MNGNLFANVELIEGLTYNNNLDLVSISTKWTIFIPIISLILPKIIK
jgi:hypothetical protein